MGNGDALILAILESSLFILHSHDARRSVDRNLIAGRDALDSALDADDSRDAVLAGHDRAMRHGAAHLHHQAAGREEEWGPARIGGRRDEDLAWLEASAGRIEDHPRLRGHDARRGRCSAERRSGRVGSRRRLGGWLSAVGKQDPWHPPALKLPLVAGAALGDEGTELGTLACAPKLWDGEEVHVVRRIETAATRQLHADRSEQGAGPSEELDEVKLGPLANPQQLAAPTEQEPDEHATEPASACGATCQLGHRRAGLRAGSPELEVRRAG